MSSRFLCEGIDHDRGQVGLGVEVEGLTYMTVRGFDVTMSNQIEAITKYWSEAIARGEEPSNKGALVVPRLNKWYTTIHRNRLRISGLVEFHPDYPDGATITTSSIKSHMSIEGRLLVSTKHSVYELGTPLHQENITGDLKDVLPDNLASFNAMPDPWRDRNTNDCTTLRHIQ